LIVALVSELNDVHVPPSIRQAKIKPLTGVRLSVPKNVRVVCLSDRTGWSPGDLCGWVPSTTTLGYGAGGRELSVTLADIDTSPSMMSYSKHQKPSRMVGSAGEMETGSQPSCAGVIVPQPDYLSPVPTAVPRTWAPSGR
jgi:hypothetical protein